MSLYDYGKGLVQQLARGIQYGHRHRLWVAALRFWPFAGFSSALRYMIPQPRAFIVKSVDDIRGQLFRP